jgi:hypothetical protein
MPAGRREQWGYGILVDPDRDNGQPDDAAAQYFKYPFHKAVSGWDVLWLIAATDVITPLFNAVLEAGNYFNRFSLAGGLHQTLQK